MRRLFHNLKIFISELGHLLCVLEYERSSEATARLVTAYRNTTGVCLELRYWLKRSPIFKVIIRGEDHVEQEVETRISNHQVHGKQWAWHNRLIYSNILCTPLCKSNHTSLTWITMFGFQFYENLNA